MGLLSRVLGRSRPPRVLVIDDDAALRTSVARVLRRAGYEVEEMEDGRRALEWLVERGGDVDLVLCDVIMPLMNGIVFGERMRELGVKVPLVYMSGLAEESALRDWGIPPSTLFVAKPFEPDRLLAVVRAATAEPSSDQRSGSS